MPSHSRYARKCASRSAHALFRDGFLVVVSICFLIVALLQALIPFDPRRSPNCRYATLAASTYIRSGLSPYQGPSCNVARAQGLQGGWDPSLPRRMAALAHHGHSSTLDRYVALVDIHHSHQRFEVYRTTPVGTWPVSRYRHREINSLRATATIAIRLMRPLALPTR